MPHDSSRPDVAVFIDFENVYVSVRDKLDANPNFESIMERCEDFGRVVIARAYADWYRYPRVTSALYANGIEPMYVPTYYYDRDMGRTGRPIKNSVDMNLCVDAMKTLFTNPNIEKFVLATGDRDFIPLVNTIRQQGKEVIIIGIGGAASAHLAQSADEFIFYEALIGKSTGRVVDDLPRAKMPEKGRDADAIEEPPARTRDREPARVEAPVPAPQATEPTPPDIYDTLVRAINLARERGYVCSFGSLKLLMKELMGGDFKESRYKDAAGRPFAKFKDFVMEAERRGKVQVFTNGTVNEVFLPGEDPYKLSQFAQDLKEETSILPIGAPVASAERSESRITSASRRRRRRRPSVRQNGQGSTEDTFDEQDQEVEEQDVIEELATSIEEADELNLIDPSMAEEIFEELLEQIEEQDTTTAELVDVNPTEILEPETSDVTAGVAAPEREPEDDAPVLESVETESDSSDAVVAGQPVGRPFDDTDWQLLREVVGGFERPISFAQIHDALRNARNRTAVGRTNEELRTLIKQGINSGLLARQGKGNRISYRLAQPAPQEAEVPAEIAAPDQMSLIEHTPGDDTAAEQTQPDADQANQADLAERAETDDQAFAQLVEQAQGDQGEMTALEQAAELASDPEQARQEVADIQREVTAIANEPDSDISGVAAMLPNNAGEQAPQVDDQQAQAPDEQISPASAQAEEVATAAAAEQPTEPKPARPRRRKQPAPEATQAAPQPEPAEQPARTSRRRRAAPAKEESAQPAQEQPQEQPKRRSRRKAESDGQS